MRLTDLKRLRYAIPLTLVVVLAVASAIIFNPAFQKKMLLEHAGPLVESLEIGSVQLTPWSLDLDHVNVGYRGGHFQVGQGSIRFCLFALLRKNLDIESLALKDVQVDLQAFTPPQAPAKPPAPPAGPFPGILGVLNQGFGYTLRQADVNAEVQLPDHRSLTATLTGKGVRPGSSGMLTLAVRFNTGKQDDHLDLGGRVYLTQQGHDHVPALEAYLDIQAALAALPETEQADITLNVRTASRAENTVAGNPGYRPETWQLVLRQSDRAALELHGTYNGNQGQFHGGYQLTANERLVQPYAGRNRIPPSQEELNGVLDFNLADLTGDMTVTSNLRVSELQQAEESSQLPEYLHLKNNFRMALLPELQLRVETLDSGLTDEASHTPLTTRLPADVQVPLQDIPGFLQQENTLLEFELPEIPLTWFDAFLPNQEITAGILSGAFTITTDTRSTLHVKPLRPLRINGLGITLADGTQYHDLNLSALPGVSYRDSVLQVSLDKVSLASGRQNLASATLAATLPMSADRKGTIHARLDSDLDVRHFADFLAGKPRHDRSLPRHLSLGLQTRIRQRSGTLEISQLDADVTKDHRTRLLNLQLQQPLVVADTANGRQLRNDQGTLATIAVSDIRLGWFSGFVPGTTLQGRLHRARFVLGADAPGRIHLDSDGPLRLDHVTVTGKQGALLEQVGVSLRPSLHTGTEGTTLSYRDLSVTGNESRLLSGNGQVTLPGTERQPLQVAGHLEADLQGLSQQPVLADVLQATIREPVRLVSDYRLSQFSDHIDFSQLAASLLYADTEPRLSVQADSGIRVRTRLGRRQSELGRARGRLTLEVRNLASGPFADILAAHGLAFDSANGKAVLESDGRSMTIDTVEPLVVTGLSVKSGKDILLQPFTLTAESGTRIEGDRLHASVNPVSVAFDRDKGAHALDGHVDLVLTGKGAAVRAESIDADIKVLLPALLAQPALLPGHTLTRGELRTVVKLNPEGHLGATTSVTDLQASKPLSLQTLLLEVDGRVEPDGSFAITAPVTTQGKSGNSVMRIEATHSVRDHDNDDVTVDINSRKFYLNDILNTLDAIAGKRPAGHGSDQPQGKAATSHEAGDTQPDTRAFWDHAGYNARIGFSMDHLYYTDYLDIQDIHAHAELTHERLALHDFAARFHDSPLTADGTLQFTGGDTPYDLRLKAGVRQFDLARFFRELEPDSQPVAEGLFDVSVDAFGRSPNMAQYRNDLYFDARLHSGKGLFRLLDPDSSLVAGTAPVTGTIGEVMSYVPTGLFGLGAVPRLVNYIKEIDYDRIDIHLVRDASRDVQIREYVVQSPEVLLTASGGIAYREGVDILQSPLQLDGQLSLRDKGAAIFYEMGLLRSKQDEWGYWKGPAFRFRGTPSNPESNLGAIIGDAGKGMVLGAITRPIAGLIGNIWHRWIGDDKPPLDYKAGESPVAPQSAPH